MKAKGRKFQKFLENTIMAIELEFAMRTKRLRNIFGAELEQVPKAPRNMQTAPTFMKLMIDARKDYRFVGEATSELEMIVSSIKQLRIEALEMALREPKFQAWADFLVEEGARETEGESEEELEEAVTS